MDIDELIDLQWDINDAVFKAPGTRVFPRTLCRPSGLINSFDRSIHAGPPGDTKRPLSEIDCNVDPLSVLNSGMTAPTMSTGALALKPCPKIQ